MFRLNRFETCEDGAYRCRSYWYDSMGEALDKAQETGGRVSEVNDDGTERVVYSRNQNGVRWEY